MTAGGLRAKPPAAVGYGGLGALPAVVGRFFVFFRIKKIFYAIGSHFTRVQSHFKEPDF